MNHMSQKSAKYTWHKQYSRNIHLGLIFTLIFLSFAFYSVPRFYAGKKVIPLPDKVIFVTPPVTEHMKKSAEPTIPKIPVASEEDDVLVDYDPDEFTYNPNELEGMAPPEPEVEEVPVYVESWMLMNPPKVLKKVEPIYPEMARRIDISGTVVCEIIIGKDGRVEKAKVIKSIAMLDEAALKAVRQWVFTPGMQRDNPVRVKMTVPFQFTLK